MSYLILPAETDSDEIPENDNGETFIHVLDRADDTIYADTETDLCEALIPGYDELDHTPDGDAEALTLRYDACVAIADDIRETLLADFAKNGEPEARAAFGKEAEDLVRQSSHVAVTLDEEWNAAVPLILISTHYAPYTELTPPEGEVAFLNPHTERSFLESTSQLGIWNYTDLREVPDEEEVVIGLDD